jgi:hypothetical protein
VLNKKPPPFYSVIEVKRMIEFSDNYGSIIDSPTEIIDCGGVWCVFYCLENLGDIRVINTFTYTSNGSCRFLKGKSETKLILQEFVPHFDLNDTTIVFFGIILTWIGFGTAFEIKNGSERTISPYLTGGTVR